MRVKLEKKDLDKLFNSSYLRNERLSSLSSELGISARTLISWKSGEYSLPHEKYLLLKKLSKDEGSNLNPIYLEDFWQNSKAGKVGARVRAEKYGQLGSIETRRKGGKASYIKRKDAENDIFAKKKVVFPPRSEKLAEFFGIMIGDGTISKYQISVSLSSIVDIPYSNYVRRLILELFNVQPTVAKLKNANCITITLSSIDLVEFLIANGLLLGHKIRQGLDIPSWICSDRSYSNACLRGIFDTDGCIFSENHFINQKNYTYPRMALVSASPNLRNSIFRALTQLDMLPKLRNNRSVNLERLTDIETYFRVIGSSNLKHLSRWQQFGGVA